MGSENGTPSSIRSDAAAFERRHQFGRVLGRRIARGDIGDQGLAPVLEDPDSKYRLVNSMSGSSQFRKIFAINVGVLIAAARKD